MIKERLEVDAGGGGIVDKPGQLGGHCVEAGRYDRADVHVTHADQSPCVLHHGTQTAFRHVTTVYRHIT